MCRVMVKRTDSGIRSPCFKPNSTYYSWIGYFTSVPWIPHLQNGKNNSLYVVGLL